MYIHVYNSSLYHMFSTVGAHLGCFPENVVINIFKLVFVNEILVLITLILLGLVLFSIYLVDYIIFKEGTSSKLQI